MQLAGLDTLFALAEMAIGLAGFSAVVVVFKRRDAGTWLAADADRFHGMVLHAMAAAAFCGLPALLAAFAEPPEQVWAVASALLGVQVAAHALLVIRLSSTGGVGRGVIALGALGVVVLQLANVLALQQPARFGPYLVGVLWHLVQAGGLFVALIWVPGVEIEDREEVSEP